MNEEKINELLKAYQNYINHPGTDESLNEIGQSLTPEMIINFIKFSINNDIHPDQVLCSLFEAIGENQTKLIYETIKTAIRSIIKWNFSSNESGHSFTLALRKIAPQVLGIKTCIKILDICFMYSIKIPETSLQRSTISDELMSLITPIFKRLWDDTGTVTIKDQTSTTREHCEQFLNKVFSFEIPSYALGAFIDAFFELPLTEEQSNQIVDSVFSSAKFSDLPSISTHLFPPLRNNPKLTNKCLKHFLNLALTVEKDVNQSEENDRAQCSLIKTLHSSSIQSKTVSECLIKILTSKTDLPTHFTPFLVSLTFFISKLNPKVKESFNRFFMDQIKDDEKKAKSKLLSHLWALESDKVPSTSLETVFTQSISLARLNLESNVTLFEEFAFFLIDTAKLDSPYLQESTSKFMNSSLRQVNIGVLILNQCLSQFPSTSSLTFDQIVERLTCSSPNSIYLIQLLSSPYHLLSIIEYIQYLDQSVVDQLIYFSAPKLSSSPESLIDRVVIISRKALFSRSEQSKLNAISSLFYLIQPSDSDLRHDIFSLLLHSFDSSPLVQAEIYSLLPLLLSQAPELSSDLSIALLSKLSSYEDNIHQFPLQLHPALPHLISSISQCFDNLSSSKDSNWLSLSSHLHNITTIASETDFEYLRDTLEIFARPSDRDTALSIIGALFLSAVGVDSDSAAALFRTYDRISHARESLERMASTDPSHRRPPSSSPFPSIPISNTQLSRLFHALSSNVNNALSGDYGAQLFALQSANTMTSRLSKCRACERSHQLSSALTLGKIIAEALDDISWAAAPAGSRAVQLEDLATGSLRTIFFFILERYGEDGVLSFFRETSFIGNEEGLRDALLNLLRRVKKYSGEGLSKAATNMCDIASSTALLGTLDLRLFESVKKLLKRQVSRNSPLTGSILGLARAFAPSTDLEWLCEVAGEVVEETSSNVIGGIVGEMQGYLEDIAWAVRHWLGRMTAADNEGAGRMAERISGIYGELIKIAEKTMEIDFGEFPAAYYEGVVKFLCEFYKKVERLLKEVGERRERNEAVGELVINITSGFDQKVVNFTLRSGRQAKGKSAQRLDKFEETHAPTLFFGMEKVRTGVQMLIDREVIDEEVRDRFCRIPGTDVKMSSRKGKKKDEGGGKEEGE